jgi:UDP-glucose 4-epimerase
VTGGAGFIGSHIAEALVVRGDQVRVLDNLSTGNRQNLATFASHVEFIEGDIQDPKLVAKALSGVDGVFHQAALASVPKSVENPMATHSACVTGTVNLLDQARQAGIKRVVQAASSSAYGDQPFSAKRELDLPLPLSPYAAAKLACEFYAQAFWNTFGLETVSLRYFNVFGPRQDPNSQYSAVIPKFITALLTGKRPIIFGDGQQSRDFTYVANVVQGNLAAMDAPDAGGKTLNVANGQSTTLLDLIRVLNQLLETKVEPEFAPPRVGDVRESLADITQARSILKYESEVDLVEGLKRSIAYYRTLAAKQV